MKKKLIRLTESDLRHIIKEVLRKTYTGYSWDIDIDELFGDAVIHEFKKFNDTNKIIRFEEIDSYFNNSEAGKKLSNKLRRLDAAIDADYHKYGSNPYDTETRLCADEADFFDEDKQELINIINSYQGENIVGIELEPNDLQEYKQILISSLDKAIANYDDFFDFEDYHNQDRWGEEYDDYYDR